MSSPPSVLTGEDRISALPDSLLCHILSFSSTKHAVATSILSKRWRPLWKSVLTLDVDEDDFTDFNSFRQFVYSVTVSRDPTLRLRSFRINCCGDEDFDPLDVNRFVHAAVQRGLEIFDLDLLSVMEHDLQELAPSVLSCKTLVVLKLSNLTIHGEIPESVDLPLLKTLHLESIFMTHNFKDVKNLFNGCPILEDLHTEDVQLDRGKGDWHDSKEEFKGFPNLVTANLCDCELNFPFVWLYNAMFMCVDVNVYSRSIYDHQVPTFHNLTHMELSFWYFDGSWPEWVTQVLQNCPKLQNLTIEASIRAPPIEDKDWNDQKTIPECLSSQLRTCSLQNFNGFEGELLFAKYILLNSKLLDTMTFKSTCYGNEKYQLLAKLSSYPKGSATCKLLFD